MTQNLDATTGKADKFDSVKIKSKTFLWQKQKHPLITKSIDRYKTVRKYLHYLPQIKD